jgi:hypothetical protein
MDHQIVSHYCKKLEKHGFIIWTTLQRNSERKIFLREAYYEKFFSIVLKCHPSLSYFESLTHKKSEEQLSILENISNSVIYPQKDPLKDISKESLKDEIKTIEDFEPTFELPPITNPDFLEMSTKERILNLIDAPEVYLSVEKPEGLTISEIAGAVGLPNQEKLVARVLAQLQKGENKWIRAQAFRMGRIFLYRYFSDRRKEVKQVKRKRAREDNKQTPGLLPLHPDISLPSSPTNFFSSILKSSHKKRSITIDTINRYIYTLNLVYSLSVVSMLDLKHHIKTDLEKHWAWDIDKKTMKRIALLLKSKGLINIYEFEIKYYMGIESSEEEEDEGEGDEYKPKKRDRKQEEKEAMSSHTKVILTRPDIDADDPRIWNDPSVTNPSLRQDKELPSTILQRVIEGKKKMEVKDEPKVEDFIVKKEIKEEHKEYLEDCVKGAKVKNSLLNGMKLAAKLDGLWERYRKEGLKEFYRIAKVAAIDRKRVVKYLKELYYGEGRTHRGYYRTEKYFMDKIDHLMQIDDIDKLDNINDYEDIPTVESEAKNDQLKFDKEYSLEDMFNDPLYDELTEYLSHQKRKKRNTKQVITKTESNMLLPIKQCLKKLYKGIDMNLLELRKEFPEGVWLTEREIIESNGFKLVSANSSFVQAIVIMKHLGIIDLYKQEKVKNSIFDNTGEEWYFWVRLATSAVPELDN